MFNPVITVKSDQYDHDDLWWEDEDGNRKGYGFRSKKNGTLALQKCPDCGAENYYSMVLEGQCAWCGWKILDNEK